MRKEARVAEANTKALKTIDKKGAYRVLVAAGVIKPIKAKAKKTD